MEACPPDFVNNLNFLLFSLPCMNIKVKVIDVDGGQFITESYVSLLKMSEETIDILWIS